jgi:hypothetical protein
MTVCEFCEHYQRGECRLGLNLPKAMTCRQFGPVIEQFCSEPKDFVDAGQIVQMATFFGFRKMELKKIKLMASGAESSRAQKRLDDADVMKQTMLALSEVDTR